MRLCEKDERRSDNLYLFRAHRQAQRVCPLGGYHAYPRVVYGSTPDEEGELRNCEL